jgi:hypothetical protein
MNLQKVICKRESFETDNFPTMKKNYCILTLLIYLPALTLIAQTQLTSSSNQHGVWVEAVSKNNKNSIRAFDSKQKPSIENWLTQASEVAIQKGLYRIRFTQEGNLLANQVKIRKVYHQEGSDQEVRALLPAGYYRIEHPQPNTMEVYFSEGANHFFTAASGYLIISGITQQNLQPIPDIIIGKTPYLAKKNKRKPTIFQLMASK